MLGHGEHGELKVHCGHLSLESCSTKSAQDAHLEAAACLIKTLNGVIEEGLHPEPHQVGALDADLRILRLIDCGDIEAKAVGEIDPLLVFSQIE